MSWEEFRTRAGQEAAKRFDLAGYRLGLVQTADAGPLLPRDDGSGEGVRGSAPPGRFFFTPDELPGLAVLLRERMPAQVHEIVREADQICRHRFSLLGYRDLDYGSPIDWHLDAVHGTRAPLKPWFKIRYLDFAEVGDHKVTWEMNRHQHLVTLAKAWRLTDEPRYASELAAQWYSWQRSNPYPMGVNWASSLEVAFRSLAWLWLRELLWPCEAVPATFRRDLGRALALNGRYIERYLSTYFSPNTHLIGEGVALFFIGMLCPEAPAARRWRERGWRIVMEETTRQVLTDGVYFEQSLYYHVYALDFFLHARLLATLNGLEIPADVDLTLTKMLEVLRALSQGGPAEGFGDDDGGRVFDPRRNRAEHLTDPLVLGAVIFGWPHLRTAAALTEEAVWLGGREGVSRFDAQPASPVPLESTAFESGGIYVMGGDDATPGSGEPGVSLMAIDAGPQGIGRSGHGHADALSVRLCLDGRRWLIDSGTFSYLGEGDERDFFRGTGAHNTLRVDGRDQAVPDGPFAWTAIPRVRADRWVRGVTFTYFAGSHTGYCRLPDPVTHRRFVVYFRAGPGSPQGFWVVRDVAEGRELHSLDVSWHFAPDLTVEREGDASMAWSASPSQDQVAIRVRLAMLPTGEGWAHELRSDWVSPAYGMKQQAPLLRSSARLRLPAECATLLLPLRDLPSPLIASGAFTWVAADSVPESRRPGAYRYTRLDAVHCFCFAGAAHETGDEWSAGPWSSDAKFLYCRLQNHRLTHLVLCDGRSVKFQGQTLASHNRQVERFEWTKQAGVIETLSSDLTAVNPVADHEMELG